MQFNDFFIRYYQGLKKKNFTTKTEDLSNRKMGKREYLDDHNTKEFMTQLDTFFVSKVEVSRMKVGKKQTLDTLINEEALLFAKYVRNERETWIPRITENVLWHLN